MVSFIGGLASVNAGDFYSRLVQPTWAPPSWLFGPVWIVLYTLIGISGWFIWKEHGFRQNPKPLLLFFIHLIPNASWSWIFFYWHQGALALANILILWMMILFTIKAFYPIHKNAARLLIPYLLWVSFATLLNLNLWWNNPNYL